ncbi:MAG: hypothetical protein CME65_11695 [Halobacteriovoraceae bacterium]|nr:hypothetical protein [Halobacteriovoraceae bacterium]
MRVFFKLLVLLFTLAFLGGAAVLGIVMYISTDLPEINSLTEYSPPLPSRVYSKDGTLLMELSLQKREIAEIEEIPPMIINAFLSAEDDNFYNHSGVDYMGIARAMVANLKAGRIVQGASTITQQVAKSLLLSSERTYTRKIKDLLLARKIEEKFSKSDILYLYLNQVYLGGGYYGVKSAFRGYFDKELSEATIAEMALVAGLLVAPSKYSPYVKPKRAKERQRYVLKRMYATEKISREEYEQALKEDVKIQIRRPVPLKAGYFTDWIRQRLIEQFGKEDFLTNGYEVVTTLDWELQEKAEKLVMEGVRAIDKRQGFKGAIKTFEDQESIAKFLSEQRDEVYDSRSNYLIFNSNGTTEKEFRVEEDEVSRIFEAEEKFLNEVDARGKVFLEPGVLVDESKFLKFVEFNKPVQAIVTKVSNSQRMIYASYAGIKLMIPYDYFKWAHERKIEEEANYWSYVSDPESIVKPGDLVLVRIIREKPEKVTPHLYGKFKTAYKSNKKLFEAIDSQKYFLAELDQEPEVQGALVSISPQTGEIISMVGGSDFSKSQFNRAVQSNRQPGSAFKPVIYAVGLENYHTPASVLLDSPAALGGVDDGLSWKPRNYDGKFKGTMTFRRALETSRNIPTIKLTQDVGVDKIINFVERLGIQADLPRDLSISLGSFGVNLLNMVKMYSIFPNGGMKTKIKSVLSIKDRDGNVHYMKDEVEKKEPELLGIGESEVPLIVEEEVEEVSSEVNPETVAENKEGEANEEKVEKQNPFLVNLNEDQVYDQRLAYLMTNLLKGVVQRGTGRRTRDISSFIGGKTGTTNNYVDAWFLGFSAKAVTGVWTGFDNNQTMGWGETGAKAALPVWRDYMQTLLRKYGDFDFSAPPGIVNVAINSETGKLYQDSGPRFIESFVEGTEPGSNTDEYSDYSNEEDSSITILDGEDYYSAQ